MCGTIGCCRGLKAGLLHGRHDGLGWLLYPVCCTIGCCRGLKAGLVHGRHDGLGWNPLLTEIDKFVEMTQSYLMLETKETKTFNQYSMKQSYKAG